jgi:hypothetical protein
MRTYLTRLAFSAAGVVLTAVGFAASAHASATIEENPEYVESIVPTEALFPSGPQYVDAGLLGHLDDLGSLPTDPSDDVSDDDPDVPDDDPQETPETEQPAEGEADSSDQSESTGDDSAPPTDDQQESTETAEESAAETTADEPTPPTDETSVTPNEKAALTANGGNMDLLIAVLVAAMAAVGLGTVGYGLGLRPQQAPRGNRR